MLFALAWENDQVDAVVESEPLNRTHDIFGWIDETGAGGVPPAHDRAARERAQLSGNVRDVPVARDRRPEPVHESIAFSFRDHNEAVGAIAHQPGEKPIVRGRFLRESRACARAREERDQREGLHADGSLGWKRWETEIIPWAGKAFYD